MINATKYKKWKEDYTSEDLSVEELTLSSYILWDIQLPCWTLQSKY